MGIDNPVHLIFIAAVALIVLGPKRLPELARSLGHGIREFRESLSESANDGDVTAPPPVPQQAQLVAASEPFLAGEAPVAGETPVADPAEPVAEPVDPARQLPSGDAPDRRPL